MTGHDRTAGTGQPEKESQSRKAIMGLAECVRQNMAYRTGLAV
jgi:hypothetical protein